MPVEGEQHIKIRLTERPKRELVERYIANSLGSGDGVVFQGKLQGNVMVGRLVDTNLPQNAPLSLDLEFLAGSPLADLSLPVRTYNSLTRAGLKSVRDVLDIAFDKDAYDIFFSLPNIGDKTIAEIAKTLLDHKVPGELLDKSLLPLLVTYFDKQELIDAGMPEEKLQKVKKVEKDPKRSRAAGRGWLTRAKHGRG